VEAALRPFVEAEASCWTIHDFMLRLKLSLSAMVQSDYLCEKAALIVIIITCTLNSLNSLAGEQGAA
jgi:hypothetical protein